jgi:predicted short-subunit dehydrogenase-like oxidoreductase (DUF2520 family)
MEMGHAITDELFEATETQRQWLHLCAVMSNNFINHLLAVNEQLCNEHQLSTAVLLPLITQTFEKARNMSPKAAQTGPAMRGDTNTINHQLQMLEKTPHLAEMYQAITKSIQAFHENSAPKA